VLDKSIVSGTSSKDNPLDAVEGEGPGNPVPAFEERTGAEYRYRYQKEGTAVHG
jgi:hypothetical protein